MPKSPMAAANWRGAPSRPSDAPDPTSSTCKPASSDKVVGESAGGRRSNRRGRNVDASAQHPPTEAGQCAADHRAEGAPHRATAGDAGEQGAERVVVGQVLDAAQQ